MLLLAPLPYPVLPPHPSHQHPLLLFFLGTYAALSPPPISRLAPPFTSPPPLLFSFLGTMPERHTHTSFLICTHAREVSSIFSRLSQGGGIFETAAHLAKHFLQIRFETEKYRLSRGNIRAGAARRPFSHSASESDVRVASESFPSHIRVTFESYPPWRR